MGFALPYNESYEISINQGTVIAPRSTGGVHTTKIRDRHGRVRHEYLVANTASLQNQLINRAVLIIERKRAVVDAEAAIMLRNIVNGTVDHIFAGEVRAYDTVTVAWISYAFNRIEFLVVQMVRETRYITAETIEGILRRFCPLPPVC